MKLAIDVREACHPQRTGKGQWARGCIEELLQRDYQCLLLSDRPVPLAWEQDNVTVQVLPCGWRWHVAARRCLRSADVNAYVSPTSFIVPALLGGSLPVIQVIHDLIAFRQEPHDWKATWLERMLLPRLVRGKTHFVTNSAATRADMQQQFSTLSADRVTTVFAGPLLSNPVLNVSDDRTILCAGTLCPRKNQLRLIQAYNQLPIDLQNRYQLVLIGGRGWHDEEIVALAQQSAGVTWRQYVSDEEYNALLSSCAMFAFPSLYEGFGLQVLDALQRGIPVLTAADGSLQEVAGDAALLVDPLQVDAITAGLKQLLTDATLQEYYRAQGPQQAAQFSWQQTVDLLEEVLTEMCQLDNVTV